MFVTSTPFVLLKSFIYHFPNHLFIILPLNSYGTIDDGTSHTQQAYFYLITLYHPKLYQISHHCGPKKYTRTSSGTKMCMTTTTPNNRKFPWEWAKVLQKIGSTKLTALTVKIISLVKPLSIIFTEIFRSWTFQNYFLQFCAAVYGVTIDSIEILENLRSSTRKGAHKKGISFILDRSMQNSFQ